MRIILWLALATSAFADHDHGKGKGHRPEAHTPEPATIAAVGVTLAFIVGARAMRRGK